MPPLADAAVSRIERGVFAALDREPAGPGALQPGIHRWRWPVVVGATALAVLAPWGMRALWRAPGLPAHGARIATVTSPSHLTVEGAAIDVAPSSAVTFAQGGDGDGDGATVLRLERGSVTCEVAPRDTRAPFVVEAGTTRVTVVGTRFAVTRVGDRAQVSVVHGTVRVDDDGVTQLVHAGESYLPGAAPGAVAQEETPAEKTETVVANARPSDITAAIAHDRVRGTTPWRDRSETRLAVSTSRAAQAAPLVHPPGERMVAVACTPDAPTTTEVARVQDTRPQAIASAALREHFESAVALEVRDPLAAFRIYRELASGTGPWAANALFAEGRLSAERGQRAAAYALLSSYLERFPGGPNADDAHALLARLKGADGWLR